MILGSKISFDYQYHLRSHEAEKRYAMISPFLSNIMMLINNSFDNFSFSIPTNKTRYPYQSWVKVVFDHGMK
jgi:hypothetical protein